MSPTRPSVNRQLFFTFLSALSLFSLRTTAQVQGMRELLFNWGQSYVKTPGHARVFYLGNEKDGYTQVDFLPKRSISFQHFDNTLHKDGSNSINIEDLPKGSQIAGFNQVGKKYYWFYFTWDRSKETEYLYAQEIDLKKMEPIGGQKELIATGRLMWMDHPVYAWNGGIARQDKWKPYVSFDSSKLLIQYRKKTEIAGRNDIIGMQMFDQDLNKLWEKEVRMPFEEVKMGYEDYKVDKEGNVYALVKLYKDKVRVGNDYRIVILKWSKDEKEAKQIVINIGTQFVNSAKLMADPQNNLIVAGCYSNKARGEGAAGVFIQRLDEQTGELTHIKNGVYAFPPEVLKEFESARTLRNNERKGNNEANSMDLVDVAMNTDGSIQIFSEEHAVEMKVLIDEAYSRFRDIIVVKIGAGGELKWVTKVPKNQFTTMDFNHLSMKQFIRNENTYLFFMDDQDNLTLDPNKAPKEFDGDDQALMVVKLDKDGKQTKAMVIKFVDYARKFIVKDFQQVAPDKMIMHGENYSGADERAYILFK